MQPDQAVQIVDLSKFYWAIGAMIVMNFGTIITVFITAAKALWWVAKLDARVQTNSKDINQAHRAIKEIKRVSDEA